MYQNLKLNAACCPFKTYKIFDLFQGINVKVYLWRKKF